jgi:hypothetical protein
MRQVSIAEFSPGVVTDNYFLSQSAAVGEPIKVSDALELAAATRALYDLIVLATWELETVEERLGLWREAAEMFEQLSQAWAGVSEDSEIVSWHRAQLERLLALVQDRVELYTLAGDSPARY